MAFLPIVLLEMESQGFSFLGAVDLCGLVMVCAGVQLANIVLGFAMKNAGLQLTFLLLLGACAASILLMGLTYKAEQYLVRKNG